MVDEKERSSRNRPPEFSGSQTPDAPGDPRGSFPVPKPAAQRISLYLRYLEALHSGGQTTISSKELGSALGLTAAQIRKDLRHFGQFRFPGVGHKIPALINDIRRILGTDRIWNAALIGVGNLGTALARYRGFEHKGFQIAAFFDADPDVGARKTLGGTIYSMDHFDEIVRAENIQIGILAVPAESAQEVADRLVNAGIRGILNFAPRVLALPEQVFSVSVDLTTQLEQLTLGLSCLGRNGGAERQK